MRYLFFSKSFSCVGFFLFFFFFANGAIAPKCKYNLTKVVMMMSYEIASVNDDDDHRERSCWGNFRAFE